MQQQFRRLAAVVVAVSCSAAAGLRAADTPVAPDAVIKHVKFLASDELGGRGNGTDQLDRAAQYIADQMKSAGLKPGGPNNSWFQPFDLVSGLTIGAGNGLTLRGADQSVSFELGSTYYPLAANAANSTRTPSTEVKQAPLVFAGYGISATALKYDDYAGVDVRGKAVLIFTHEPQESDAKSVFNGAQFSTYSTLMEKAMAARSRGAVALVAVSDPSHDTDNGTYREFSRDPQAENYGIPVLRIERRTMEPLLKTWGIDPLAKQIDADLKPKSRALPNATLEYTERLARTRRSVKNIIGVLPGSDPARAGESIVIGAHYDHLGLGGRHAMNPELAGQIHNGADDNASGTAAVIEIGRAAAANRKRFPRTMIFIAFAGEELGLLGSAHYVQHPTMPIERTVAMLNLDMVGRAKGKIMVSGLSASPSVGNDLDAALAIVTGLEARRFQEGAGVGSSDDTSFAVKKVPAIGFFSGFHPDYHRPTDDWQLIDADGAARVASLAFELASRLSSRADKPEFVAQAASPSHSASAGGEPGAVGGYGPYFGSVPDFSESDNGVKFSEVRENSPAGRAGLRGGDIMTVFAGKPTKTLVDFTFALREHKPGDEVEVTVIRDGKPLTVKVLLTPRP